MTRIMIRLCSGIGCLILALSMQLLLPYVVHCSEKTHYYYLQTSSFRNGERAIVCARNLNSSSLNTVIRGEDVKELGFWYRVYVGPYSTKQKLETARQESKGKGIIDHSIIHRKKKPITGNLKFAKNEVPGSTKLKDTSFGKIPEKVKKTFKNKSRNIHKGDLVLGLKHSSIEIDTALEKRRLVTFNGTTTSTTDISVKSNEKNDYPTNMKIDNLRLRFGLTDYVEIFADAGAAYDDISDTGFVYGGGARIKLFEINDGNYKGLYGAVQGEFLDGSVKSDYVSRAGNPWEKDTDFKATTARVEIGVMRPQFEVYGGGVFFHYRENTERTQLKNLPAAFTSVKYQDELGEKDNIGAFGGIAYRFTPSLSILLEGQIGNMKGAFISFEYSY